MLGVVLAFAAAAAPAATTTDFGLRAIGSIPRAAGPRPSVAVHPIVESGPSFGTSFSSGGRAVNIGTIAAIGSAWGRVTSTTRSVQHNRRVGGVRNSFHLSGRAVDIARRPGVRHADIAAAYRKAGYHLAESLDEGDHSHFAFGAAPVRARTQYAAQASSGRSASGTQWRIVMAPR